MAVTISQNGQKRQNCYSYEVLATVSDLLSAWYDLVVSWHSLVPRPKPTPARIAFSIALYCKRYTRWIKGLGTRLARVRSCVDRLCTWGV